jgi:peptidoglycan-associated lipoprotein
MTTTRSAVIVLVTAALLAVGMVGCSSKAKPKSTSETTPTTAETTTTPPPSEPPPTPPAEPFPQQPIEKTTVVEPTIEELNRQGVLKTVYFAYNSNDIDDAAKAILQANADWLKSHPKYRVEIGGHCDERGSIGYNVALGDRRANAVKEYLVNLAVDGNLLVPISYGEEKPVDPGHDEAAWAKNRRAEFTIKP